MALERLRASVRTQGIPVIVISGALEEFSRKRLEELGVVGIMAKPPQLDELAEMIEAAGSAG